MRRTVLIAGAIVLLSAPAPAQAFMTLNPDRVPNAGATRVDVQVVNDRDYTSATSVRLRAPPGFDLAPQTTPGWRLKLTRDGRGHVVDVLWTSDGRQHWIGPKQFQDFGLLVGAVGEPGTMIRFAGEVKLVNDEIDRWEGTPNDPTPFPQVTLTGAPDRAVAATRSSGARVKEAAAVAARAPDDGGGDAPTWLALLALAVGVLGLLAGIGGLAAARRRGTPA